MLYSFPVRETLIADLNNLNSEIVMEIIILLLLAYGLFGMREQLFQDVNTKWSIGEEVQTLNNLNFYESAGITNNQIRGVKSAEEQQTQNPDVFFHRERRMHDD